MENAEVMTERLKRDEQFAYEHFARSFFAGAILQFACWAIERYSTNNKIPSGLAQDIKESSKVRKFCIGRIVKDLPIGLIIYAGRNQAMHFSDSELHSLSKKIFDKLKYYYSPRFDKVFISSYYDLSDPNIVNYAENILYLLDWHNYEAYEKDILEMLSI